MVQLMVYKKDEKNKVKPAEKAYVKVYAIFFDFAIEFC